jgi:hypothetical protein
LHWVESASRSARATLDFGSTRAGVLLPDSTRLGKVKEFCLF